MPRTTPPRLYCVPAARAPIVAVFRRGPTSWSHVGRWHLRENRYEPGAWLRGRVFPRRSDLSPDGRWLCYFAHKPTAAWETGDAYVAISRLPWLTALHAFPTCGTWTRGYHFTDVPTAGAVAAEAGTLPMPFGLAATRPAQFATEQRLGWHESPDSPPRASDDMWDQRRNARIRKQQPGRAAWLHAESVGHAGGAFGVAQAIDGLRVRYWLETGRALAALDDLQWADWNPDGRLLAATRDGRLQVRTADGRCGAVVFEHDLSGLVPTPAAAPDWAREW